MLFWYRLQCSWLFIAVDHRVATPNLITDLKQGGTVYPALFRQPLSKQASNCQRGLRATPEIEARGLRWFPKNALAMTSQSMQLRQLTPFFWYLIVKPESFDD
jgi:hypothetical protein